MQTPTFGDQSQLHPVAESHRSNKWSLHPPGESIPRKPAVTQSPRLAGSSLDCSKCQTAVLGSAALLRPGNTVRSSGGPGGGIPVLLRQMRKPRHGLKELLQTPILSWESGLRQNQQEDADTLLVPELRRRQRPTDGAWPAGGSSRGGPGCSQTVPSPQGLAEGEWPFPRLSPAPASGRPCLLFSGAWPSHCSCTFSKLKTHCCPFLGKKS